MEDNEKTKAIEIAYTKDTREKIHMIRCKRNFHQKPKHCINLTLRRIDNFQSIGNTIHKILFFKNNISHTGIG